ncbi:DUF742 domain-containing protein [Streptomyces sp. NPDC091272]|uniref:DUF742 domain-containing protein n=1 Tax=Streptomyces sp. NPDC091272 TaxID=3365981 RepID=UPI0038190CED
MIEHQRAAAGSTQWYDAEAGPLVRPYAQSGVRADPERPLAPLDLVAELTAVTGAGEPDPALLGHAHRTLLTLCRTGPLTVAELAASADLPTGAVRTLLNDLLAAGQLALNTPARPDGLPAELPVQELIEGLRAL